MSAPVTTLDAIHTAILAAMQAQFGDRIAQYGAYQPWDSVAEAPARDFRAPMLLLQIRFRVGSLDDPSGRLPIVCTARLHCVLSALTPDLPQALLGFASETVSLVHARADVGYRRGNLWGLTGAAESPDPATVDEGDLVAGVHGLDSLVVEFDQVFYLA